MSVQEWNNIYEPHGMTDVYQLYQHSASRRIQQNNGKWYPTHHRMTASSRKTLTASTSFSGSRPPGTRAETKRLWQRRSNGHGGRPSTSAQMGSQCSSSNEPEAHLVPSFLHDRWLLNTSNDRIRTLYVLAHLSVSYHIPSSCEHVAAFYSA